MIVQTDTRQKPTKHNINIESYFKARGIGIVRSKMLVGDYCIPSKGGTVVDTKQGLLELYNNLVGDHYRFAKECQLAKKCDITLVILVANDVGIESIDDVLNWKNPLNKNYQYRKEYALDIGTKIPKPPVKNQTLVRIMNTMTERYNVQFLFCDEADTGQRILEILGATPNRRNAQVS